MMDQLQKDIQQARRDIWDAKQRLRKLRNSLADQDGWPRMAYGQDRWMSEPEIYLVLGMELTLYIGRKINGATVENCGTLDRQKVCWEIEPDDGGEPKWLSDDECRKIAAKHPKRKWTRYFLEAE